MADFGIIFFLFEMGLELSIKKVLSMRDEVFGLGMLQFGATAAVIACVAKFLDPRVDASTLVVLGGSLALSSSAFVLQFLRENNQLGTRYGRASFSVLLFQDLAVVPLLVVVPILAGDGSGFGLIAALALALAKATFALTLICAGGYLTLRRVFYFVKQSKSSEAFLSVTLVVVLLCSKITEGLGLSNTLGAFVGGILVAETEYRHQVEADIAPFRSMLLGLFFVTVGYSIDLHMVARSSQTLFPLLVGVLALKALVVVGVELLWGLSGASAVQSAAMLAPGGEFAFVVFGLAERLGILGEPSYDLLVTATVVSMALTPVLAAAGATIATRLRKRRGLGNFRGRGKIAVADVEVVRRAASGFVVICGFGQIGATVCKLLDAETTVKYIVFENDVVKAIEARSRGLPVFLVDCSKREVLQNFKVGQARLVVIAIQDQATTDACATAIRQMYPNLPVLARAVDEEHRKKLKERLSVDSFVTTLARASVLLALPFGGAVLRQLGCRIGQVEGLIEEERRKVVADFGLEDVVDMVRQKEPGRAPACDTAGTLEGQHDVEEKAV